MGSFFVYSLFLISLLDSKPSATAAYFSTWIVALVLEIVLVADSLALYTYAHYQPTAGHLENPKLQLYMTEREAAEVAIDLLRIVLLLALIGFYLVSVVLPGARKAQEQGTSEESTSLLGNGAERAEHGHANGANGNGSYGSVHPVGGKHQHTEGAPPAWSRPTGAPTRSWWEYIKGYSVFFPNLWPSKDRKLQTIGSWRCHWLLPGQV